MDENLELYEILDENFSIRNKYNIYIGSNLVTCIYVFLHIKLNVYCLDY
jgi:hypothetical protein